VGDGVTDGSDDVGDAVGCGVAVADAVGVGVTVAVAVGVGVTPDCCPQYLPPVFK
jgi:hypothetical protein